MLLLALTWDPEVVVLSGGVSTLGNVLRDAIADPSVALGPIGAVRAAHAASLVPSP